MLNIQEKISVYIPVYNGAEYLPHSIASVLDQTVPPDEIIIVDDGSTDNSAEIAAQFPVTIIRHAKNRGLSAARNTGIEAAQNNIIVSVDADCALKPNWLEILVPLVQNGNVGGAGGRLVEKFCDSTADMWRSLHCRQTFGDDVLINPPFLYGHASVFKKECLRAAGLYDVRFTSHGDDVYISHRLKEMGYDLIYNPAALVEHYKVDTLRSIIKASWKWDFFGHLDDVTAKNTIRHVAWLAIRKLPNLVREDIKAGRLDCTALSAVAIVYGMIKDLEYYGKHPRQKAMLK